MNRKGSCEQKKPVFKGYKLHDSIQMTFSERQNKNGENSLELARISSGRKVWLSL